MKKSNKTYIKETKGKSFRTISYLLRTYTYLLNVKKIIYYSFYLQNKQINIQQTYLYLNELNSKSFDSVDYKNNIFYVSL